MPTEFEELEAKHKEVEDRHLSRGYNIDMAMVGSFLNLIVAVLLGLGRIIVTEMQETRKANKKNADDTIQAIKDHCKP